MLFGRLCGKRLCGKSSPLDPHANPMKVIHIYIYFITQPLRSLPLHPIINPFPTFSPPFAFWPRSPPVPQTMSLPPTTRFIPDNKADPSLPSGTLFPICRHHYCRLSPRTVRCACRPLVPPVRDLAAGLRPQIGFCTRSIECA